jgi:RNA-directed DNA polymerase
MSLVTPEVIRRLQRKLYLKAKAEPDFRFYQLYDKIYREDIFPMPTGWRVPITARRGGWRNLRDDRGGWVGGVAVQPQERIAYQEYKPQPVGRVMISKPGGGERPLGLPTIRDRMVLTAVKLVIEPIFEAGLEPAAYGYRPQPGAQDALKEGHPRLCQGYHEVVDADLAPYFGTIPQRELMQSVARRISDRHVWALIKKWLKAPVKEVDGRGRRRLTGGKRSTCGPPQGGMWKTGSRKAKSPCAGTRPAARGLRRATAG